MVSYTSVQAFKAFKAEQEKVTAQLQQRLAAAEQACQERDQTIARFKEAMGQENGEAAFLNAMQSPETLRPSSQGPLSPVQSYAKYVSVVQERNRLKKEYENLQAEWEEVATCNLCAQQTSCPTEVHLVYHFSLPSSKLSIESPTTFATQHCPLVHLVSAGLSQHRGVKSGQCSLRGKLFQRPRRLSRR